MKDLYKSKKLLSCDNIGTVRSEKEWLDRYMIKASERDTMFEKVTGGSVSKESVSEDLYENIVLIPYDTMKGKQRTEKEWLDRYMIKASERTSIFKKVERNV